MNYKDFLDNQGFWKEAYCAAMSCGEFSPENRAKSADKAVDMFLERQRQALKEQEDAEIAGRLAPNHFEIEDK
ncbi:hypothetical protein UFOVP1290_199 [uncultured Caudovirales phage]|uniref:Uncharacterized protein n=1 Tax=uncultured Caudovirales phage TaxID=2100421 RepID=A0A6J5RI35_9CAUD|nr:hypothetical protein UFOVP1290_199 [uncultured Caudovirales phage]